MKFKIKTILFFLIVFTVLPNAANSQTITPLVKLSSAEIQKRGTELAAQIEYAHLHQEEFPPVYLHSDLTLSSVTSPSYQNEKRIVGYDTTSLVTKFIPVGISFNDAEAILVVANLKMKRVYAADIIKTYIKGIKYSAEIQTYAVATKYWICDGCIMNSDEITISLETEKTDDFRYVFKIGSTNRIKK
jgi:hypothetical protein